MMISVEQLILIFLIAMVYWLVGNFISVIAGSKKKDPVMAYTTVLAWPLLLALLVIYWIVQIILAVVGGGTKASERD